ncbi:MAG TPA: prepilin-type N-terminal cleavage/methylation domain-containing protein [Gemmatimonadaceae bacterium]|nr:prepilin-type N-terminal cleavage/methylation domain-containing protein [Gemmatimonadaceae bacterium]
MTTPMLPRARRGVTLIEMMIALTLFVAVFGLAVPFFKMQARSLSASAGRLDAQQNARFSQNTVDRDLRLAGTGVLSNQPMIVQADKFALTFNADIVTRDANDLNAAYYDPDVDSMSTASMITTQQITLPHSAVTYPQMNYVQNGLPGAAETISYWTSLDSTVAAGNEYVLFRRVNDGTPKVVASGIIWNAGDLPIFTYYKPDSVGNLVAIPAASLPLYHNAAAHGSVADTGKFAWVDSIRMVTIRVAGTYDDPQKGIVTRVVQTSTQLLNAGMLHSTVCGTPPIAPTSFTAVYDTTTPAKVILSWPESLDQDAGEKDIERYLIYRRAAGDPTWTDVVTSVAASSPTYTYDDINPPSGSWQYGVVAQDCSPSNSTIVTAGAVTVP